MKRYINNKLFIVLIVVLAAVLRFYQLSSVPPSLTWDEAAWGYNAYSIGTDGKDEFGRYLPHDYLESFGDFKPPLYAYLDVIPVKMFGLNEFAVRFPSALFGTLTVLLTYFLVKRIFYNAKDKEKYAILSAFILAISPWHILLSRAAFEANISTFLIIVGVWAFLAAMQDKKRYLIISAVSFALSFYAFNTARIVSPILVLLLAVVFRKKLIQLKRETVTAAIIGLVVFLPIAGFLITPQASLRFKEVNIFSNPETIEISNTEIQNDNNAIWSKILHNRRVLFGIDYAKHYFDNLSPLFLFTKGDGNPKFSTQTNGQMYIWDIPFFIIGILFLIRKKEGNWWLVPLWLLIGIIPAAAARETPHGLRIESSIPMFQIFTAYGAAWVFSNIKKYKNILFLLISSILLLNFAYFAHDYFVHYPKDYSGEWQYGYKESISYVSENLDKYEKVYITTELGRPYAYYLFYNKTSPVEFRQNSKVTRDAFGFVTVEQLGKLNFVKNPSSPSYRNKKTLYISDKLNVPDDAVILKTFRLLNGDTALIAYTL